MLLVLYLILIAAVGLGIYAALVRRSPNRAFVPMLGPGVVLLALAGIGILRLLPIDAAQNTTRVLIALALLWIGWLGLMALVVQMVQNRLPGSYPWPGLTGAVAALAPIAGFLIARTMA